MSDILKPIISKHEVILSVTAKPPKEKFHPGSGLAQSLDSASDELQAYGTIHSANINEITKHIKNNPEAEKNLLLLQKETDALEVIEVADALATIDSPWESLAQEIAHAHRVTHAIPENTSRQAYVDKLLFPLGAELFRDIRSMTNDPLTRQLMFQSIADEIINKPDAIRLAQASLPLPKDAGTVKQAMRRVALGLLGVKLNGNESESQIDSLYKKSVHEAVLRSRLSAEQPIFDIAAMEHARENAKQDADQTITPFAKEEAAMSLREIQAEVNDMKRIRKIIDRELPSVYDETFLMKALDHVQKARFEDIREELAPYKLEPWVPEHVRSTARSELEKISIPKEDLYAKVLKKLDEAERRFRFGNTTWGEKRYKDHMRWLGDPVAQANRNQRIINIIDLLMTITTLVSGVSGNLQRQIEGNYPSGMTIRDYINYVESQHPWEVAADLATPKPPKIIEHKA